MFMFFIRFLTLHMTSSTNNKRCKVPNITFPITETISKETYDGLLPLGRVYLEKRVGIKAKLLRCKREIIVSTMIIRTIREEHKELELKYNFESHDLDILGIQEHRIMHDETVKYNTIGHSTLITTPAWKNDQGASTAGIGIMLNKI